jgi:hypothetical protein
VKVYGYSMNFMMRKSLTDLQSESLPPAQFACLDNNNTPTPCITVSKSEIPMIIHQPLAEPLLSLDKLQEENDE